MAALHPDPYPLPDLTWDDDWRNSAHERAFATLAEVASKVDFEQTLLGGMVRFRVADGYAHYLVVKQSPLTLQHVPYGDAYSVPAYTIRGLRRADIGTMLASERRLRQLFSG